MIRKKINKNKRKKTSKTLNSLNNYNKNNDHIQLNDESISWKNKEVNDKNNNNLNTGSDINIDFIQDKEIVNLKDAAGMKSDNIENKTQTENKNENNGINATQEEFNTFVKWI